MSCVVSKPNNLAVDFCDLKWVANRYKWDTAWVYEYDVVIVIPSTSCVLEVSLPVNVAVLVLLKREHVSVSVGVLIHKSKFVN